MPIYEYRCNTCETVFEKLVFSGDKVEIRCPKCQGTKVTKIMSASSFMGASIGTCAAGAPRGFS